MINSNSTHKQVKKPIIYGVEQIKQGAESNAPSV